ALGNRLRHSGYFAQGPHCQRAAGGKAKSCFRPLLRRLRLRLVTRKHRGGPALRPVSVSPHRILCRRAARLFADILYRRTPKYRLNLDPERLVLTTQTTTLIPSAIGSTD